MHNLCGSASAGLHAHRRSRSAHSGQDASAPLPGTKPLTIDEPLDEVMVAGISRFALRALKDSPRRQRRPVGTRLCECGRIHQERGRQTASGCDTIIGAVDRRETADGFELVAKFGGDGVVARSDGFGGLCRPLAGPARRHGRRAVASAARGRRSREWSHFQMPIGRRKCSREWRPE